MFLQKRVYPCNSFFSTLGTKRREHNGAFNEDEPEERSLELLHPDNLIIVCGEVDGVVLGAWTSIDEQIVPSEVDDDSSHAAYWTAAVAWSDAWDQRDIDRVSHIFVVSYFLKPRLMQVWRLGIRTNIFQLVNIVDETFLQQTKKFVQLYLRSGPILSQVRNMYN